MGLGLDLDRRAPRDHCSGERPARQSCWYRIPGKHRNRDAAWDALEDMIATRH